MDQKNIVNLLKSPPPNPITFLMVHPEVKERKDESWFKPLSARAQLHKTVVTLTGILCNRFTRIKDAAFIT